MIRAKNIRSMYVLNGETTVNAEELVALRRKARGHDAYVEATRRMRGELQTVEGSREFVGGYLTALDRFGRFVMEETG